MSDDHPFGGARRSRMGPAVLIAALVLAIGLGLMIFAIRDEPGWLRRGSDAGAAARTATQPAQQAPPAAAVDTDTLSQRETALAAQIASLEARAATLGSSTANAEGRAGRAEAILIAFAARRAIDRGLGLGYLEEQIRARFAGAPREASAVIRASRNPVTLESLRQDLDTAAPVLLARESSWWGGLGAELRNLVVIHEAGTPSPLPADRLARVRRLVDAGRVEEALVEVKRLPGAANAASWTTAAQRYVDAHRALDQLETIAIVGPVAPPAAAPGQVIQSPALPIQPQPAPTADLGNYL